MMLNIAGGEDTRAGRKTWRADHRANGQGLPLAENSFPSVPSSAVKSPGKEPEEGSSGHRHLEGRAGKSVRQERVQLLPPLVLPALS